MKGPAGSIKCTANTARQTLGHWIQWLTSLNHATIAGDGAHSHRPHEKEKGERGMSDFHGSGPPDKRLGDSAASGQNHMTLAHRKSPTFSFVRDIIKNPPAPTQRQKAGEGESAGGRMGRRGEGVRSDTGVFGG